MNDNTKRIISRFAGIIWVVLVAAVVIVTYGISCLIMKETNIAEASMKSIALTISSLLGILTYIVVGFIYIKK